MMIDLYDCYNRFIEDVKFDKEPFFEEYKERLSKLNALVFSTGEFLEGSLFSKHGGKEIDECPNPPFKFRRRNYVRYVVTGYSLLEIGFNAGHSALLALTANKHLKYTGVDIGRAKYTRVAYDFLKKEFGDRIDVYFGDSRSLLPTLSRNKYELFHIDGGHTAEIAHADLTSVMKIAPINSFILFDDSSTVHLAQIIQFYIIAGFLAPEYAMGSWEGKDQVLLRVLKDM
jgi:hypothetical protein